MGYLIELWDLLIGALPWDWAQAHFMHLPLLAVLLAAPLLGLLGTQVVGMRMAFFSDSMGHAGLTGVALGVVAGLGDPVWAMLPWAVALALLMTWVWRRSRAGTDTVLGVFTAFAVALGVVLLTRSGGMQKYVVYLTGDPLSVTPTAIGGLSLALAAAVLLAVRWFNALALAAVSPALAGSRRVNVAAVQAAFAVLVAVAVTLNIPWVGILLVNALLVIPAAAARLVARTMKQYVFLSIGIALVSGVGGLLSSFYWDTATSATIVLWAVALFVCALAAQPWRQGEISGAAGVGDAGA